MEGLITARQWPVFEDYRVVEVVNQPMIGPVPGAEVRTRLDLLDPYARHQALQSAVRLIHASRAKIERREGDRAATCATALGLLDVDTDKLLDHVRQYGLLGLGPANLVRVVQLAKGHAGTVSVFEQAGRLRWGEVETKKGFSGPRVTMRGVSFGDPPWDYLNPPAKKLEDAFEYLVGSDEWWARYAEPVDDVIQSIGALSLGAASLEPLLEGTFVSLPEYTGFAIERRDIGWRSISAIGALALGVAEGELKGWGICEYELCQKAFERKRSDQRFCSPTCKSSKHDRDRRRARQEKRDVTEP